MKCQRYLCAHKSLNRWIHKAAICFSSISANHTTLFLWIPFSNMPGKPWCDFKCLFCWIQGSFSHVEPIHVLQRNEVMEGGMKGRADGKSIWEVWCNKDTGCLWGNIWKRFIHACKTNPHLLSNLHLHSGILARLYDTLQTYWTEASYPCFLTMMRGWKLN